MTMSPVAKESTSVGLSLRRYCLLSARIRASDTIAMAMSPRARAGATRASQGARPGARTPRPRSSVTVTVIRVFRVLRGVLPGSTERFVRLHDLLDEAVAHHVLVVE